MIDQKFETIHTGARGVVRDRFAVDVNGDVMQAARVLMVNGHGRVEHKTLHPLILVKVQIH